MWFAFPSLFWNVILAQIACEERTPSADKNAGEIMEPPRPTQTTSNASEKTAVPATTTTASDTEIRVDYAGMKRRELQVRMCLLPLHILLT